MGVGVQLTAFARSARGGGQSKVRKSASARNEAGLLVTTKGAVTPAWCWGGAALRVADVRHSCLRLAGWP